MNNVNLIGRLTKDIELRKSQNGMSIASFTLAVNRAFKKDEADFITCKAFDKRAETMAQYLRRGNQVGVTGRIETGSYDRNGQRVYTTDVIVEGFTFCESKRNEQPSQTEYEPIYHESVANIQAIGISDNDLPF